MKRILVTGGAGFIGSHLCARLVNDGHDVICLDNYFTGSKKNVWHLIGRPNFELVRHNVINPYFAEVDEIYNLACPASPIHYQFDPIKTTKTSVMGALNMLGLAKETKARLLQASTSEVYGDPIVHPQTESYWGHVNPIGIRSCYDEGKRCAESLCMDYHRQHGIEIKIIRIFNTYGPGMLPNDGRVVSNFIVQALQGNDLTIYGDGQQTRSFQYVDDLIEGMVRMMASPADFLGPVNLGNPHATRRGPQTHHRIFPLAELIQTFVSVNRGPRPHNPNPNRASDASRNQSFGIYGADRRRYYSECPAVKSVDRKPEIQDRYRG